MKKRNSQTQLAALRKVALAHAESITEPARGATEPPKADASAPSPLATNGDEEVSIGRLPEDGAPRPEPAPVPPTPAELSLMPNPPLAADTLRPLEQRIRRLEDALAQIQERRGPEPHVAVCPTDRLSPPAQTATLFDVGKRLLPTAASTVTQAAIPPRSTQQSTSGRLAWLLWDTLAEARAIVRMFVDPRYNMPWPARVLPVLVLAGILTSYYWVPGTSIPVLGGLIDKAVDLLLALLLFKWLGHEARRYRQTSPDLPPTLRL